MKTSAAEILREYGPFPGIDRVHGVTFDGQHVWFASGDKLNALDPEIGKTMRSINVAAHAGTAFDGKHLFQIAEDRIQKIDPKTGRVLATIPAPGGVVTPGSRGPKERSGWASIATARSIKSIPKQGRSGPAERPHSDCLGHERPANRRQDMRAVCEHGLRLGKVTAAYI